MKLYIAEVIYNAEDWEIVSVCDSPENALDRILQYQATVPLEYVDTLKFIIQVTTLNDPHNEHDMVLNVIQEDGIYCI